ncbi:LysR family transcriptional regulator [Scleromatobacter humisilvae]|uniref:LysR family transcriptional regulator n=1 Tax=Scleromatobacter humisilvae TaxID=2897159 RepID=A0A9X1YKS8_9BURK|nr:LysR family transcriptional regulator [Scleromatobacter humisilvae]MCK9686725.1 LysR family transcriptional regulator [Scleromatobacter humisilvae]
MRELNLDQLRTLVAIADLGTFSAAGRALHLAQPTVSLHISELEGRLGTPLLLRGPRRVTPTAAGADLVARARRLLREADDAVAAVQRHRDGQEGRVRLACSAGATTYLLPKLVEAFEAAHPNIDVQLTLGTSAALMARLFTDDADLALVALPQTGYPTLALTPMRRTPIMAILPAACKAPAAVTPAWLAKQPLILDEPATHVAQAVHAWLANAGLRARLRVEVTINEITRQLVAAGYGVSVLPFEHPDETLGGRLQVRPLRPALVRRLGVAHRPLEQLAAPTRRVLDTLMTFREAR